MTEKLKRKLVGIFVLGSVGILISALMLFGSGTLFEKSFSFVCYFPGSLKGLVAGSPVLFHGVPVGRVTAIYVVTGSEKDLYSTPVILELDKDLVFQSDDSTFFTQEDANDIIRAYVADGLRAQLGTQSLLTGQLSVELSMQKDPTPVNIDALPEYEGLMQIPAVENVLDQVVSKLTDISFKELGNRADELFSELTTSLTIINDAIGNDNLKNLFTSYTELAQNLNKEVVAYSALRKDLEIILANFVNVSKNADELVAENAIEITKLITSLESLAEQADGVMKEVGFIIEEDSATMFELSKTMKALQEASYAVSEFATLLEIKPDALIFGK